MSVEFKKALDLALDKAFVIKESQKVALEESLNRVLANNIYAKRDLPPFDNSAMDGYAFKYKDINEALNEVGTILAGDKREYTLKDKECLKIMTGAKVPKDCDTIAQIELTKKENGKVFIDKSIKKYNAIRRKGEELEKGVVLLEKGTLLTPANIALLASQGINEIEVFRKLKIAIIATGSELKELGEKANKDELYNINAINIKLHLKKIGFDSKYLGIIPDNLEQSVEFIKKLNNFDVIITTGGISKGDADFTKKAFLENSMREIFHGVKVKPGHPTMFGIMNTTYIMAMPGNPLAAILNIFTLSLPVLRKLGGVKNYQNNFYKFRLSSDLKLKGDRVNLILGEVKEDKFYPYNNNKYGSGMIIPLVKSNVLAVLEKNSYKENDLIDIIFI